MSRLFALSGGVNFRVDRDCGLVCATDLWRAAGSPSGKEPERWQLPEGDLAEMRTPPGEGHQLWFPWQEGFRYAESLGYGVHSMMIAGSHTEPTQLN